MGIESNVPKEMQDAVRDLLGRHHQLGYLAIVQFEVKPERWENRLLVLTEYRVCVLLCRVPTKVESTMCYIDLQSIRSTTNKMLTLNTGHRILNFGAVEGDTRGFDAAVHHIIKALVTIYPAVPLERILPKLTLSSDRLTAVNEQVKLLQQKEPGPCGGFSTTYRCTCDYHGNTFMEEVAWDVDTIYLSHDSHHLNLGDFDHLEPRHLPPLISALEHNTWFTGLVAENVAKLGPDSLKEILKVMRKNVTVEELCLSNCGIRGDFVNQLSQALMSNANSPLAKLDLSNNLIEDKGTNQLGTPITQLSRGLAHLDLSRTGITARGTNRLADALQGNKFMNTTLQYINLSDNPLKGEELSSLFNFLAQPNAVIELNLSGTECALEGLFGALLRGCTQKLKYLRLARNVFTHRKVRDVQVPQAWHRFFASCLSLMHVDLSETRLPLEAIKMVLLGIGSNPNHGGVELILSGNGLGMAGPEFIQTCFANLNNIATLDITDNSFDSLIPLLMDQLSGLPHLKKLLIGKNFNGIKPKNLTQVLETVVQLVQDEDGGIESLSLADSKLKLDTVVIINALGGNSSLTEIDLSGNLMGDIGARMLAKAIQINTGLRVVYWDRNNTTPQGFADVAAALEKNFALREMPTPVIDATVALRLNQEKTTKALSKIESLLQRNHSPRKFASDQAFRLQQGLLLSSTQQMVDHLVIQVQDSLKRLMRIGVSSDAQVDVDRAIAFIKEAEKATQILPRLQEVALQFEMEGNPIHRTLRSLSTNLHTVIDNQLKQNLSDMLKCSEDQCPTVMGDKSLKQELQQTCKEKSALSDKFTQGLMVEQVGTDVNNKVGELNLAVAAHISESLVDSVLHSLETSNKILLRHLKTAVARPSVSDSIKEAEEANGVSSPKKKDLLQPQQPAECFNVSTLKRRSRRPQSVIDAADVEKARKLAAEARAREGIKESVSESPSTPRRTPVMDARNNSPSRSEKPTTPVPAPRHNKMKRSESGTSRYGLIQEEKSPEKKPALVSSNNTVHKLETRKEEVMEVTASDGATKVATTTESPQVERKRAMPEKTLVRPDSLVDSDKEEDESEDKFEEKVLDIQEDSISVDTIDSLDVSTVESSLDSSRGSTPSFDAISSPYKQRGSQSSTLDEDLDKLTSLEPGPKLQHLAKSRPKRAKTRAVSRAVLTSEEIQNEESDVQEFFDNKPVDKDPLSPPPTSKQRDFNHQNSAEEKHKAEKAEKEEMGTAKKKGWSPSLPSIGTKSITQGLSGLFHKKGAHSSPESSRKNPDSSKDKTGVKTPDGERSDARTPDRSKTPDPDRSGAKTPDKEKSGAKTPDRDEPNPKKKKVPTATLR